MKRNFRKYSLCLVVGLWALLCLPQVNTLGPANFQGMANAGFFNNDLESSFTRLCLKDLLPSGP